MGCAQRQENMTENEDKNQVHRNRSRNERDEGTGTWHFEELARAAQCSVLSNPAGVLSPATVSNVSFIAL